MLFTTTVFAKLFNKKSATTDSSAMASSTKQIDTARSESLLKVLKGLELFDQEPPRLEQDYAHDTMTAKETQNLGDCSQKWKLKMIFLGPEALKDGQDGVKPDSYPQWGAVVSLTTRNLPELMKSGLYIRQENVIRQDSHMEYIPGQLGDVKPWARHYEIRGPGWAGHLKVATFNSKWLAEFRVEHLTVDRVHDVSVVDELGRYCYSYCAMESKLIYNCIYDDMPLNGLWPWPRGEDVVDVKDEKDPFEDGWEVLS